MVKKQTKQKKQRTYEDLIREIGVRVISIKKRNDGYKDYIATVKYCGDKYYIDCEVMHDGIEDIYFFIFNFFKEKFDNEELKQKIEEINSGKW